MVGRRVMSRCGYGVVAARPGSGRRSICERSGEDQPTTNPKPNTNKTPTSPKPTTKRGGVVKELKKTGHGLVVLSTDIATRGG